MRNYIQAITFGLSVLALRTLREKEYWRKQTGKHITIAMLGVVVMLGVSDVTLAVPIPFSNTIDFAANGTQTVSSDTRTVTTVSDNAPFIFTHSVTFSPRSRRLRCRSSARLWHLLTLTYR